MKKRRKWIAVFPVMAAAVALFGFGMTMQAKAEPDKSPKMEVLMEEATEDESETADVTIEYEESCEPGNEAVWETEFEEDTEDIIEETETEETEENSGQQKEQPELSDTAQEPEVEDEPLTGVEEYGYQYETGYIFLGDSRIYLMNQDCNIAAPGNFFAVCCPGIGYDWMMETGLPKIKNIQSIHSEIKNWVVISALGINDMQNVNKYISAYQKLSKSVELWLVSINPTVGRTEAQYSNVCIEAFNRRIRKISGITYINSHDYLVKKGYDTKDGLHYTEASNWDIYSYILNSLLVGIDCAPAADTDAKQLAQSLEEELSRANY